MFLTQPRYHGNDVEVDVISVRILYAHDKWRPWICLHAMPNVDDRNANDAETKEAVVN